MIFILYVTFFRYEAFSQNSIADLTDLDLDFKVEEFEKKPYSINTMIEAEGILSVLDKNALLYKQKYLDKNINSAWQTNIDLTLEGRYEKESIKLFGRFNGLFYTNEDINFELERKTEEAYIAFQPSFSLAIEAGKKVHKWGKGYAYSPTAFFSRPKDINDPDATLEGYYTLSADYIKSMTGIVKTFAATPVLMPVTRDLNHEIGPEDELIWGGRFYFLAFDTDMDLMFFVSDNMHDRVGFDFSKNLSPSFEIHGDAALIKDYKQTILDENGNIGEKEYSTFGLLVGCRYLSNSETTYILEYYRNGLGYSDQEYENYLTFIETGYEHYSNTSNKTLIEKSKMVSSYFNRQLVMKDYLYLKISQKDAFDILYFVPGLTIVYNINDKSASITPQITYTPLTNLVLYLKTTFLFGSSKTEYEEKANNAKITLTIRYYF